MTVRIITGCCRDALRTLSVGSVQCCITSPPYYGLRDYGVNGQIGLEASPDAYVAELVAVFREVRRVLRDDGTLWLNLGDSYASQTKGTGGSDASHLLASSQGRATLAGCSRSLAWQGMASRKVGMGDAKPKDLLGIPWMVAFALRADGWWLRSDVIWHKPNPMPESVTDRPTSAHEHVFLLSKSDRHFYDTDAIREEITSGRAPSRKAKKAPPGKAGLGRDGTPYDGEGTDRNARNVWTIATQPFSGAHFATMPSVLVERCIRAGSKPGDAVLDPFGGAGTTGLVADRLNRDAVLIELNPAYAVLARDRVAGDAGMFAKVAAE